jgi:glycosyltransferase involved in cell wall biosynthesis
MIKLSILVPTVPSRINYFYPKIMNELIKQIGDRKDIELIALFDNKKRSIGQKRQEMVVISQGKYITFIDDDDRISEDYIDEIMKAIDENDDSDCIVYEVICCIEGDLKKHCKYGIEFEYGDINQDGTEWRGKPAHTMVWKSEIVKRHRYNDLGHGEDYDWVKRAWQDIKKQIRIDKILYYYDANYSTTSETSGIADEIIKENIEKLTSKM